MRIFQNLIQLWLTCPQWGGHAFHIEHLPIRLEHLSPLGWGEVFQPNGESVKIIIQLPCFIVLLFHLQRNRKRIGQCFLGLFVAFGVLGAQFDDVLPCWDICGE